MAGDVLTVIAVDVAKGLTASFVSVLIVQLTTYHPSFTPYSLALFSSGLAVLLPLVFCDTSFERQRFYYVVGVCYLAILGTLLVSSLTVWLNSCIHLFALVYVYINRAPPWGTCWDSVRKSAFELCKEIDFEHSATLDGMVSNNLIDSPSAETISKNMLNWTSHDSYWLLTKVLPWSYDSGFFKFCCLLHAKGNLPKVGRKLCKECNGFSFQTCKFNESVQFVFDSSCQSLADKINGGDLDFFFIVPLVLKYVDKPERMKSQMVYNASIVCMTDRIVASMLVSMEEDCINKSAFRENMASYLKVDSTEVKIQYTKKHSTWMLLHLSSRAGLRLLQTFSAREFRDRFGQTIAKALKADSAKNVSIQVKISDLPSSTIFVIPTGEFSVKWDEDVYVFTDGMISVSLRMIFKLIMFLVCADSLGMWIIGE